MTDDNWSNSARDGRPTVKEVAERAGVAMSSVSRVLTNHPDVSNRMRQRVLAAIEAVGYEPNLVASSLRSGSTNTVGLIVADITNPLMAEFSKGADSRLARAGFSMVLANSDSKPERDEEVARMFRWRQVDGMIVSLSDQSHPGTIEELSRHEKPIVLFDRSLPGLRHASLVSADHASGMRQATKHLLDLGHRRIALITGPEGLRPTQERLKGYTQAYEAVGIPSPSNLLKLGAFEADFGEEQSIELLEREAPPTAVIAGSNQVLVGVLRALRRLNLVVGVDVALISCDDVPVAELHTPSITVVYRDVMRMGEIAADLLLERLADPTAEPRAEVVPTSLVVRESTFPV